MDLDLKRKVILSGSALLAAFALGRYSVPTQPNVKVLQTQQVATQTETDKDVHETTHTVVTKEPSGKTVTETATTKDTVSRVDQDQAVQTKLDVAQTAPKLPKTSVSALAGLDRSFVPVYGISVQREFLGPITIGAFALTNATFGVSVGVNF